MEPFVLLGALAGPAVLGWRVVRRGAPWGLPVALCCAILLGGYEPQREPSWGVPQLWLAVAGVAAPVAWGWAVGALIRPGSSRRSDLRTAGAVVALALALAALALAADLTDPHPRWYLRFAQLGPLAAVPMATRTDDRWDREALLVAVTGALGAVAAGLVELELDWISVARTAVRLHPATAGVVTGAVGLATLALAGARAGRRWIGAEVAIGVVAAGAFGLRHLGDLRLLALAAWLQPVGTWVRVAAPDPPRMTPTPHWELDSASFGSGGCDGPVECLVTSDGPRDPVTLRPDACRTPPAPAPPTFLVWRYLLSGADRWSTLDPPAGRLACLLALGSDGIPRWIPFSSYSGSRAVLGEDDHGRLRLEGGPTYDLVPASAPAIRAELRRRGTFVLQLDRRASWPIGRVVETCLGAVGCLLDGRAPGTCAEDTYALCGPDGTVGASWGEPPPEESAPYTVLPDRIRIDVVGCPTCGPDGRHYVLRRPDLLSDDQLDQFLRELGADGWPRMHSRDAWAACLAGGTCDVAGLRPPRPSR